MTAQKLLDKIDELNEKYIKIWEDVCNIESPTNCKAKVDEVGQYFINMAKEKGWQTEVFEQSKSGNVICITMNPDSTDAPVCYSGHIDTVHPIGLFSSPAVTFDDQKIYGPGVTDCKGGVVASFMAMDALGSIGFASRPVMILIQTDEEVGSSLSNKETIKYICQKSQNAIAFFNTEGSEYGEVVLTRKGILRCRFAISGKAAHSARCMNGASAIAEAAHKILELEKFKDLNGITCNCGTINGGSVANTVPEKCEFVADIRFADDTQLKYVREELQKISSKSFVEGCTSEVCEISYRPAMPLVDKNLDLLKKMNEIYSKTGLPILEWENAMEGSDAAYATEYGIPCVDSIGVEGDCIHSKNEFALLSSLALSAKQQAVFAYMA